MLDVLILPLFAEDLDGEREAVDRVVDVERTFEVREVDLLVSSKSSSGNTLSARLSATLLAFLIMPPPLLVILSFIFERVEALRLCDGLARFSDVFGSVPYLCKSCACRDSEAYLRSRNPTGSSLCLPLILVPSNCGKASLTAERELDDGRDWKEVAE
jgi:hypothetical protein